MRTIAFVSILIAAILVAPGCGGGGSEGDNGTSPSGYVLDLGFGEDGVVRIDPTSEDDFLVEIQALSDGSIAAVGTASRLATNQLLVLRALFGGTPDPDFGTDGLFVNGTGLMGRALAVDEANDRLLVAADDGGDILFTRILADGLPDPTFGSSGTKTHDLGGFESVDSIFLLADGKILVAGSRDSEFLVMRLLAGGDLDPSFDTNGYRTISMGSSSCTVWGAAAASDGSIVLTGIAYEGGDQRFAAARVLASGALDSGFGSGGTLVHGFVGMTDGFANHVVLKPDGRILLVGHVSDDFAVLGLLTNGQVDPEIGERRLSWPDSQRQPDGAWNLSGNRVLVAGYSSPGGLLIWRLLGDGSNDPTFGSGGTQVVSFPSVVYDLALDAGGGIVGAGASGGRGQLVRFVPE